MGRRKTQEEWKQQVKVLGGGDYVPVSNYKDVMTKVSVEHNKCATVYEVTPNNFINGHRCPRCTQSSGELLVERYLAEKGITYETQKTFPELRRINKLRFDFYVPQARVLIEYQGSQHYYPNEFFGGLDEFKLQQERDDIKRAFAEENGYVLVEIPHTIKTLEGIRDMLETKLL